MIHSPGEWYAYRHVHTDPLSSKKCYQIDIRGNPVKNAIGKILGSEPVCSLYAGFVHFEGNAALILAAPKLFAACEAFEKYASENCQDETTSWDQVRELVREALKVAQTPPN